METTVYKATQRGFTLIELVVVIVILGILAAFALPKFMGLETQARIASVRALEGTLRSSAAMAHSVWVASGSAGNIAIPGNPAPIPITIVNGYPNRATIDDTLETGTIDVANPATPGRFRYNEQNGLFSLTGAGVNVNQCGIVYTNAAANAVPGLQVRTAGC